MLNLKVVKITDNFKIMRMFCLFKDSFFDVCLNKKIVLRCLLTKNCYYLIKRKREFGILIVDRLNLKIHFISLKPINNILLEELLKLILSNSKLTNYSFNFYYNNILKNSIINYMNFEENLKYMYIRPALRDIEYIDGVVVKRLIEGEERIRATLQNKIFRNTSVGRIDISPEEIIKEELSPNFIEDMCFVIYYNREMAGYSQIMINNESFFLVNFGIIPEFRNKGLGKYLLNRVLCECFKKGIKKLYLAVDNNNLNAINLYKGEGFKELYNRGSIKIKGE